MHVVSEFTLVVNTKVSVKEIKKKLKLPHPLYRPQKS